jgi:hypothetical protein
MFWTLGAVVIAALAGTIAVRTSERSRAQLWRGSLLTAVIGVVSGILGSVTGNLVVFYGGNLAFLLGVFLAAVALTRRYEPSQPSRIAVPQVITKLVVVFFVLVLSGVVLWVRQTSDALLRVGSFGGAVAEVLFFALPSLVAFALIPRRWWGIAASAAVLAWFTIADWWSSATFSGSTASLGPAFTGWFIVPSLLVAGGFASWVFHMGREGIRERLDVLRSRRSRRVR